MFVLNKKNNNNFYYYLTFKIKAFKYKPLYFVLCKINYYNSKSILIKNNFINKFHLMHNSLCEKRDFDPKIKKQLRSWKMRAYNMGRSNNLMAVLSRVYDESKPSLVKRLIVFAFSECNTNFKISHQWTRSDHSQTILNYFFVLK